MAVDYLFVLHKRNNDFWNQFSSLLHVSLYKTQFHFSQSVLSTVNKLLQNNIMGIETSLISLEIFTYERV